MGRVKRNKPRRVRGLNPPTSFLPAGYTMTGASRGLFDEAHLEGQVCPACGEDYIEVGYTDGNQEVLSCRHGHCWDSATRELTVESTPPEHRETDDDDLD